MNSARGSTFGFKTIAALSGLVLFAHAAWAQSRTNLEALELATKNDPALTICSQNLEMYGTYSEVRDKHNGFSLQDFFQKEEALAQRLISAKCDVIAVQEVIARTDQRATELLENFAKVLKKNSGRLFHVQAGYSNDETMHNGLLVAADRASIANVVSYEKVELPKLSADQKPRFFGRGPIEVQLSVKARAGRASKLVSVIVYHFKSRAGSGDDPADLGWETYRIEMAEALRRIIEERHAENLSSGQSILVLLGDRNADFDSATAKILDGTLSLSNFQTGGACRLSKRGTPLCRAGTPKIPELFSVLTLDPQTKLLPGTFRHKKSWYWLDDIMLPAPALGFAWLTPQVEGDFDSGVISEPPEASDHSMVYVRLRW